MPDGWLVVLGRRARPLEGEALKAFAAGLELDPFIARQRLLLPTPQVLRRETLQSGANRWVSWLKAFQLPGYCVAETELELCRPVLVEFITLRGTDLIFELFGAEPAVVPLTGLLGVCRGDLRRRVLSERSERDYIYGEVRNTTETRSVELLSVLDLHLASDQRLFRITPERFRALGFFGTDREEGSVVWMKRLVAWLLEQAPHLNVADDFSRVGLGQMATRELLGSDFRTVFHAALVPGTSSVRGEVTRHLLESEEGAFWLYSALTRLDLLRS